MIRSLAAVLLLSASATHADPRADVLAVVDAALVAVSTSDAALFEKVMLPNAVIVSQSYRPGAGTLTTRSYTVAEMAARMRQPGARLDERRTATTVHLQRDLAHVWAEYFLDVDGKRRHCGVDSFALVKQDGTWQINSLTWTAEPDGCPPSATP